MHTNDQAKLLWCPMGRVGVMPSARGPSSINDPSVEFRTNCQGSGCAMWRWGPPTSLSERRRGFCGLAGAPAQAVAT